MRSALSEGARFLHTRFVNISQTPDNWGASRFQTPETLLSRVEINEGVLVALVLVQKSICLVHVQLITIFNAHSSIYTTLVPNHHSRFYLPLRTFSRTEHSLIQDAAQQDCDHASRCGGSGNNGHECYHTRHDPRHEVPCSPSSERRTGYSLW